MQLELVNVQAEAESNKERSGIGLTSHQGRWCWIKGPDVVCLLGCGVHASHDHCLCTAFNFKHQVRLALQREGVLLLRCWRTLIGCAARHLTGQSWRPSAASICTRTGSRIAGKVLQAAQSCGYTPTGVETIAIQCLTCGQRWHASIGDRPTLTSHISTS